MSFEKKTWVKRTSEYPNRRKLTKEDGSTEIVTVDRYEGSISAEGDAFSPENMNDLEERIKKGFASLRTMHKNPAAFGINASNAEATLSTMLEAMDATSHVRFWINNSNQYKGVYTEVLAGIQTVEPNITSAYGHVDIWKNDSTSYVTFTDYSNPRKVFKINYSTVNSVGWSKWDKVATSSDLVNYEKKVSKRKFVFVSDSYGIGYNPDGDNFTSTWVTHAANVLSTDYVNLSQGGAGLVAEPTFASIVEAVEVDETVTDVIVAGGYNDGDTAFDSILTGVKNLYNACKAKYPNAQVSFAYIAASKDVNYSYILFTGMSRIEKACQYYKIRWLSGTNRWYKLGYDGLFSSDGFHPSSTGHLWIGRAVAKAYRNGYTPLLTETTAVTLTNDSSVESVSGTDTLFAFINGDVTTVTTQGNLTVTLASASSVFANGANAFTIGSLTAFNKLLGISSGVANQPVNAVIRDSGVFKECKGTLSLAGGELKFKPFAVNVDGSNFETFSSVDTIIIQSFCLIYPTDLV